MLLEQMAKKQAAARLKVLARRIDELTAERVMLEQFLASGEMRSFTRGARLRKNGVGKLNLQGQVRRLLLDEKDPVKASVIYDALRQRDASLKSATFRSHMMRLTDAKIIERAGQRGYYQLVETGNGEGSENEQGRRRLYRQKPVLRYT